MNCRWVFILLILLQACTTSKTRNDLTANNIKGNVKSVSVLYYQAVEKFGMMREGELTGTNRTLYDSKGFAIEYDELVRKSFYRYVFNEQNQPSEKNTYNSDSTLVSKETYLYDNVGNKIA